MTPGVRREAENIIEARVADLETELLLLRAASQDPETFTPEQVRKWALHILPVLEDLHEWAHHLKETETT
jgi:hypothetical protein